MTRKLTTRIERGVGGIRRCVGIASRAITTLWAVFTGRTLNKRILAFATIRGGTTVPFSKTLRARMAEFAAPVAGRAV